MHRLLSIILSVAFAALTILGQERIERESVWVKPVEVSGGEIATDTLAGEILECDWHVRVELPRRSDRPAWHVKIDYNDGASCTVKVERIGQSIADNDFAAPMLITTTYTDGTQSSVDEQLLRDGIDPTIDSWSMTLRRMPGERELTWSLGQRNALISIPLRGDGIACISATADTLLKLLRMTADIDFVHNEMTSIAETADELDARIAESENTADGYWRYLDRDTDPRRLNTGGNYSLATVTADDGTVELVYIDGAKANGSMWKPLMIKGRLTPTVFTGHYDLVWYDAYGRAISAETSADIIDGSILRLNFPLHGGSIRFQCVTGHQ